jgi:hypothetical protein
VPDPLLGLCPPELCSSPAAVRRLRRPYPPDLGLPACQPTRLGPRRPSAPPPMKRFPTGDVGRRSALRPQTGERTAETDRGDDRPKSTTASSLRQQRRNAAASRRLRRGPNRDAPLDRNRISVPRPEPAAETTDPKPSTRANGPCRTPSSPSSPPPRIRPKASSATTARHDRRNGQARPNAEANGSPNELPGCQVSVPVFRVLLHMGVRHK